VISFYIVDLHFNLGVKLLNDKFGIQTRGGCSCAGTYGHHLLEVSHKMSSDLIDEITLGDLIRKPGWIRLSVHPTTTNAEIEMVCDSLISLSKNHKEWAADYLYNHKTNEFENKNPTNSEFQLVESLFL
ncbi:MAG: selenocysteine lyase, partial [Flavobacterium sp.]|nr:selenocysteine lyase [Flavobacterium sp.]